LPSSSHAAFAQAPAYRFSLLQMPTIGKASPGQRPSTPPPRFAATVSSMAWNSRCWVHGGTIFASKYFPAGKGSSAPRSSLTVADLAMLLSRRGPRA
ncbi:hypothetical protein COCCADRAFT_105964, partial [Bipolaris zeicola 26-R-13]